MGDQEPKYSVPEAVIVEIPNPFHERFRFEVAAGTHSPKSEEEELAFEHLVGLGLASKQGGPDSGTESPPSSEAPKSEPARRKRAS